MDTAHAVNMVRPYVVRNSYPKLFRFGDKYFGYNSLRKDDLAPPAGIRVSDRFIVSQSQ